MGIDGIERLVPLTIQERSSENVDQQVTRKIRKNDNAFSKNSENFKMEDIKTNQISSVDEQAVMQAIDKANRVIEGSGRIFQYSIHEKTGDIMIKIVDEQTNEVILEVPPEKLLDIIAGMCEIAGIFIDKRI